MTQPGFVPRINRDITDRLVALEKRVRNIQQNVAGTTVATGGVALSSTPPQPVGTAAAGTAVSSSRSDHVHASTIAAQGDASVASPALNQFLVWNGSAWQNTTFVSATYGAADKATLGGYLPYFLSYGGMGDYVLYGDALSTSTRTQVTSTWAMSAAARTLVILFPFTQKVGSYTGVSTYVTTAMSGGAATGALFMGSSVNALARISSNFTMPLTAGVNQVAVSGITPGNGYVALQIVLTSTPTIYPIFGATPAVSTAAFLSPSGASTTGASSGTSAPGSTLDMTTGWTSQAQRVWASLY